MPHRPCRDFPPLPARRSSSTLRLSLIVSLALLLSACQERTTIEVQFFCPGCESAPDRIETAANDQPPNLQRSRCGSLDGDKLSSAYRELIEQLRAELAESRLRESVKLKFAPTEGALDTVLAIEGLAGDEVNSTTHAITRSNGKRQKRPYGVGLVQSDVLFHFVQGGHPQLEFSRNVSNVRALARAFEEWLFIRVESSVSSEPLDLSWPALLNAERVNADGVGSGTMFTTINFARFAQPLWAGKLHHPLLDKGTAGIQFCVLSPKMYKRERNLLFGIPATVASNLEGVHEDGYRQINTQTFQDFRNAPDSTALVSNGQGATDTTIAVDAILVVSREMPADVVHAMECVLWRWDRDICELPLRAEPYGCAELLSPISQHTRSRGATRIKRTGYCDLPTKQLPPTPEDRSDDQHRSRVRLDDLPLRLHRTASIRQLGSLSRAVLHINGWWMLGLLFASSAIFFYREYQRFGGLSRSALVYEAVELGKLIWPVALGLSLGTAVLTTAIWVAEFHSQNIHVNGDFIAAGVRGALYWAFQFIFTNSSDVALRSIGATIYFGVMKLLWTVGSLTPSLTVLQNAWKRHAAVAKRSEHVVVLGWNNQTGDLLEQLVGEKGGAVLIPFVPPPATINPRVHILATITDLSAEVLETAKISKAAALIIVADNRQADIRKVTTDMHTLQMVQLYRQLEFTHKLRSRPIRLVVEVVSNENLRLAQQLGQPLQDKQEQGQGQGRTADANVCQVLSRKALTASLIAHAIVKPNTDAIFEGLVENNASDEFYEVTVARLHRELPFDNYNTLKQVLARTVGQVSATPVGLRLHDDAAPSQVHMNPSGEVAARPLGAQDTVVFIARDEPSIFHALRERCH